MMDKCQGCGDEHYNEYWATSAINDGCLLLACRSCAKTYRQNGWTLKALARSAVAADQAAEAGGEGTHTQVLTADGWGDPNWPPAEAGGGGGGWERKRWLDLAGGVGVD